MHRALCLSLSFSARWCVCVGSRCALSLWHESAWRQRCVAAVVCVPMAGIVCCCATDCRVPRVFLCAAAGAGAGGVLVVGHGAIGRVRCNARMAGICVCCVLCVGHPACRANVALCVWTMLCLLLLLLLLMEHWMAASGACLMEWRDEWGKATVLCGCCCWRRRRRRSVCPLCFLCCVCECLCCGVVSQDGQLWCAWRCFVCSAVQCSVCQSDEETRMACKDGQDHAARL